MSGGAHAVGVVMSSDGVVVVRGRGALPFTSLHGAPLYLHALQALADLGEPPVLLIDDGPEQGPAVDSEALPAGTRVLTLDAWWADRPDGAVLLHDSLCPLAPSSLLAGVRELVRVDPASGAAAYRPVTDTVKTVEGDLIQGTIDRERLAIVTSPVALGGALLAGTSAPPPLDDFAELVRWARGRATVAMLKAPAIGRRVEDEASVQLLECVDEIGRQPSRVSPLRQ
jgi:2-C-methyl-D-erythritol 4-phosphate cytidylyltransferase